MSNKKRGFAAMKPEEIQRIASLGGKAISMNRAHMQEIGRKGGKISGLMRLEKKFSQE